VIETPNAHEAIIDRKVFDQAQVRLSQNRNTRVVRFKDNIYHLSGVLYCRQCGLPFRGNMIVTSHKTGAKKAWYRCASISYLGRKCRNRAVPLEYLEQQVWDILDAVVSNVWVLDNLKEAIQIAKSEPEEHYFNLVKELEAKLEKNLEKQKGLYEIYRSDSINLELYKIEAEKLRLEEKKLRTEIRHNQIKILENQNTADNTLLVHGFLSRVRNLTHAKEFSDHDIKELVRILFKRIEIDDQKIVHFELHQPWKLCYEKGIKTCQKKEKPSPKLPPRKAAPSAVYCAPSAVR